MGIGVCTRGRERAGGQRDAARTVERDRLTQSAEVNDRCPSSWTLHDSIRSHRKKTAEEGRACLHRCQVGKDAAFSQTEAEAAWLCRHRGGYLDRERHFQSNVSDEPWWGEALQLGSFFFLFSGESAYVVEELVNVYVFPALNAL